MNLKKHLLSMIILAANTIAVTIYVNSDITILGIFENDVSVGIYSISAKIYKIVKSLLNALIVVTIPRLSYFIGNNKMIEYNNLLNKLLNYLLIILIPAICGLFVLSKQVIFILAGKEYILGKVSLNILCISLLFAIIASFCVNAILLPNKEEKNVLKGTIFGINGAAMTTLIAEAFVAIYSYIVGKKFFKISIEFKNFFSICIGSLCVCVICSFIKNIFLNDLSILTLSVILSVFVYFIILLIFKNTVILEIIREIKIKINEKMYAKR
jgi:O-antigen/teichoic acid export membrane protein